MPEHGIYTKEGVSLIKRALNASTEKGALVFSIWTGGFSDESQRTCNAGKEDNAL